MSGGRQRGPDQLRGILLTLVIFGHTYAAGVSEDRSKWLLYGFHMPLFFAISGWLLSRASLTGKTLPQLLGYYSRRMIWQWLLVSVAFGLWKGKLPTSPQDTIGILLYDPLFHLWFIPALILMVVITQVVLRAGCGWWTLAAIGIGSFVLFELPAGKGYVPESLTALDSRYGAYFIWFLLGFAVRNATWTRPPPKVTVPAGLVVTVAGVVIYNQAFDGGAWRHDIGFGLFNLGLVILLPAMISVLNRPIPLIGDAMSRVGKGSLWIYLLHPFVTEIWRPHDDGTARDRAIGALITAGIVIVATIASHISERLRAPAQRPAQRPAHIGRETAQPHREAPQPQREVVQPEREAAQPAGPAHTGGTAPITRPIDIAGAENQHRTTAPATEAGSRPL